LSTPAFQTKIRVTAVKSPDPPSLHETLEAICLGCLGLGPRLITMLLIQLCIS